jgi:16S rRNA (guanine1516-N2)-methyltransferase
MPSSADPRLASVCVLASGGDAARALAARLRVECVDAPQPHHRHVLVCSGGRLEIHSARGARGAIAVDFLAGPFARRWRGPTSRRTPLARAIGIARGARTVVDATAGLGRDAFSLACLGCEVLAVERSPVVAELVADGLRRACADPAGRARIGDRLRLCCADARDVLSALAPDERPDVVYLDPMLERGSKDAQVKKEMQLLQELLGADPDAGELLDVARAVARQRVVVKRPLHARPLAPADASFASARARWDAYLQRD